MAEEGYAGMTTGVAADGGRPLQIAIVSQYFWPEDFRINELAIGLTERGHHVTVLTGLPNYPAGSFFKGYGWLGPWRELYFGVDVLRVPLTPRGKKSKIGLALNYLSFAAFACLLAPFRLRKKHDVVFVYQTSPVTVGYPALILGRLWKAPVFLWVLDLWPESLAAYGLAVSGNAERIGRWLARPVYGKSDQVLSASAGFGDNIRRTAGRDVLVRHFPQWGAKVTGDGPAVYDAMPELPDGFKVMFTGNIGASQDLETILAAATALREKSDIHWVIVGDGHHLEWVKQHIIKQNLTQTVHCLGRHPSSSMPAFFAKADVLLATLRDEPAFALTVPAKIQSYLSASKPIVTAINGEVASIVRESGAGIAVPAGDAAALAAAVAHMAALPQLERDAMGLRGKSYFDANFVQDKLFDQLVVWFRQAVDLGSQSAETAASPRTGI